MANFDVLAERGRKFFLQYDQTAMIRGYGLEADAEYLYLRFCAEPFRVERQTARVLRADGSPAGPAESLAIFDMLCGKGAETGLSGQWCRTNSLPGCGQTSPDDVVLNASVTARFERDLPGLRRACAALGGADFPVGDAASVLPVFDWFPAVFQFFLGDEEFPSTVRFLWDRNALSYLRYETLYYVMDCVLRRLGALLP